MHHRFLGAIASALLIVATGLGAAPAIGESVDLDAADAPKSRKPVPVTSTTDAHGRAVEALLDLQEKPGLRFHERGSAAGDRPMPNPALRAATASAEALAPGARGAQAPAVGPSGLFGSGLNAEAARRQTVSTSAESMSPARRQHMEANATGLRADEDASPPLFIGMKLTFLVESIRFLREHRTEVLGIAVLGLLIAGAVMARRRRS